MARKTVPDDFKVFSKRLSGLMKERGLKQQNLADFLGIKRQTVSLYMTGKSMPDAKQLKDIADFFDVSADWLLDRSHLVHKESNEETAKTLELPERFVSELRAILDRNLTFEVNTLKSILASDGFWGAIQSISSAAVECFVSRNGNVEGQIEDGTLPKVRELDCEVRDFTNQTFCVYRTSFKIGGLQFTAQEYFNHAVQEYLDSIKSSAE